MPVTGVTPRPTLHTLTTAEIDGSDTTPILGLRASAKSADACSAEVLKPDPHTAKRVISHILKPLPMWGLSGAGVYGAMFFAALPGNGILVGICVLLAIIAALSAAWRHIDIEHEHKQDQKIETLERKDRCDDTRVPERIASADRRPLTTPLNALTLPG